jgi:hypothetical protein
MTDTNEFFPKETTYFIFETLTHNKLVDNL